MYVAMHVGQIAKGGEEKGKVIFTHIFSFSPLDILLPSGSNSITNAGC
jgi:hypothetical protein